MNGAPPGRSADAAAGSGTAGTCGGRWAANGWTAAGGSLVGPNAGAGAGSAGWPQEEGAAWPYAGAGSPGGL
ncbi:hypothetical protein GCM10018962_09080 [Dactylosporangium matsuzakiense]|uniref:hypothetical protein n=1 Tax=Dactylosporangium matsuzakiense TaxID=53360 RepID=UPI0031EEE7AB